MRYLLAISPVLWKITKITNSLSVAFHLHVEFVRTKKLYISLFGKCFKYKKTLFLKLPSVTLGNFRDFSKHAIIVFSLNWNIGEIYISFQKLKGSKLHRDTPQRILKIRFQLSLNNFQSRHTPSVNNKCGGHGPHYLNCVGPLIIEFY